MRKKMRKKLNLFKGVLEEEKMDSKATKLIIVSMLVILVWLAFKLRLKINRVEDDSEKQNNI